MEQSILKQIFENFEKLKSSYTDKYVGKKMKMYIGNTEDAKKEYSILRFEVYAVSLHDSGYLIKKTNTWEEVIPIVDTTDDFNIRVVFENKDRKEEEIKFSRFIQANRLGL